VSIPFTSSPPFVRVYQGPGHHLASATIPEVRSLSPAAFQSAVTDVFLAVLGALATTASPHPVRMWHFIPGIHEPMGRGMDRYRVFNAARFDAFAQWFRTEGPEITAAFAGVLPAASGVGHEADEFSVHALGSAMPGVAVENPRQTPAYRYSIVHGPRPPCFSRAVIADLAPAHQRTTLLVSGTASVRGERSMHDGDLVAQLDESIENIVALAKSVREPCRFALSGMTTARVYHTRAEDRAWLVGALRSQLPASASVELLPAAACRPELLVEIEATIAATRAGTRRSVRTS
jgi:hypothetical protein